MKVVNSKAFPFSLPSDLHHPLTMKFNLHHKEVRQISLILSILLKPKKQDRK
jgi:hypothetical protein